MGSKALPVLGLPFRNYPTRRDRQHYEDERRVCRDCLSGACCESEDPIYLSSLDVFRLAAFFNIAPAEFLLSFTQERFGDSRDEIRKQLIDDPNCSIVTFLRRRENFPASPCIFLKYVREPDGTPRRICSVYEARPLACREFYFNTCKKRVTGELAALLAEGYEKLRDGEITETRVDAEMDRLSSNGAHEATLGETMERWFWVEMKRALNLEDANVEGSSSYNISDFQDPIDEKLNRVLSAKYIRFEERYGSKPRGAQLTPYTAGLGFASSPECERVMRIVRTPPSSDLYASHGDEVGVGVRTLMPGAKHASVFATIPDQVCECFLSALPPAMLFPGHASLEVRAVTLRDVYSAVLKGYNHLIRFASYLAAMGNVLEGVRPGEFESELLAMIASFETSLNPFIARNSHFEPVKRHMTEAALTLLERELAARLPPKRLFKLLRLLSRAQGAVRTLSPELRSRFESVAQGVHARLQKDKLDTYVRGDNPVESRRRAGKRLNSRPAWEAWCDQVLDMGYAAEARFAGLDLGSFYAQSVDELEVLPFRKSYAQELSAVIISLARSMSSHGTIAYHKMAYKDAANRLAAYAIRLLNWIEDKQVSLDWEIIIELASSVYKGLGMGYNHDRNFGVAVHRVLKSQLPDGSWKTDPFPEDMPDCQVDYLRTMYRATWACVDLLRPMRSDMLNPDNAALGLV